VLESQYRNAVASGPLRRTIRVFSAYSFADDVNTLL
jgi:hypothetical protein